MKGEAVLKAVIVELMPLGWQSNAWFCHVSETSSVQFLHQICLTFYISIHHQNSGSLLYVYKLIYFQVHTSSQDDSDLRKKIHLCIKHETDFFCFSTWALAVEVASLWVYDLDNYARPKEKVVEEEHLLSFSLQSNVIQ